MMKKHFIKIIVIFCSFFTVFCDQISGQSFIQDSLDAYIKQGMKDWQVPGLAIVIIKDGKVIKRQGYGVKDIKSNALVDEHTHFFIASNSKLFTGTAIAKLHQEGKLSIQDRITKYYPEFKLFDETSTKMVTIKDMLTHRIGTKTFQGDFTFWDTKLTSEEIMFRMRYLKPINGFRDAYGYCNSCFLTAGMVIPKVTGKSWSQYITDEIIKPLEMSETFALSNDIASRSQNIAKPYSTSFTDIVNEVPYDIWDNLAPAASIVSNVYDLTNWLTFQLDSGRYEGKTIMPWKVLQMTRDVAITTNSRKSASIPTHFRGYGLGVFSSDYNGKQIYWHTGGAAGMVSNFCFVPEEKLGIAILTNNDNQNFFELLRLQILDSYLDVPFADRSKSNLPAHREEMVKQVGDVEQWLTIVSKNDNHKLKLRDYEGDYTHELYGNMSIKSHGKSLKATFYTHPNLSAILEYMGNEEWLLTYSNIEFGIFKTTFIKNMDKITGLNIKVNDFVEYDVYEFIKK